MAQTQTAKAEARQVGKFSLIGIFNTVIDFGIFNVLTQILLLAAIPANIVSTGTAMTFSFFANKLWVFRNRQQEFLNQAVQFVVVTLFGLWVIQNGVIFVLQNVWTWPLELGAAIVAALNLDTVFSQKFVFDNGAKVIATGFSLVWNYLLYKKVVFKND